MALTGVGAVLGGAAGYSCGCLIGGIIGGGGGTLVAPGVGTLGGAGAGCGAGGSWAGAGGAAAGGAAGNAAANAVCDDDKCPPCKLLDGTEVPVGTIAFRPLDTPATIQHGISGPHYNIYKANQAPRDSPKPCQCFWQPMGAVPPAGLPPGAIPIQPFAN